jgi:hypothetical protein
MILKNEMEKREEEAETAKARRRSNGRQPNLEVATAQVGQLLRMFASFGRLNIRGS